MSDLPSKKELEENAARLERMVDRRKAAQKAQEAERLAPYGFDAMPTDPEGLARLAAAMKADEKPVEPMPLAELGMAEPFDTQQTCEGCREVFATKAIMVFNRPLCPQFCPKCVEARGADEAREKREDREERWERICPPDYRDTDLSRIRLDWAKAYISAMDVRRKVQLTVDEILETGADDGLLLAGASGLRKTRIMFLILKKFHFAGYRCAYINGATFADDYAAKFEHVGAAERYIKALTDCPILFYDDLGKEPKSAKTGLISDRSEEALYRIVEARKAHRRKMFITSNMDSRGMLERFSQDRGEPIVRRLKEMCRMILITKPEKKGAK